MFLKRIQQLMSMLSMLVLVALMAASCSNNDDDSDSSAAVGMVVGTYQATITPTMGTKKMAQGPHLVVLEAINGNKQVRFHFEKFNAPMFDSDGKLSATARMPFAVSVDFVMGVRREKDGTVRLQSVKGTFKAKPNGGKEVDPDKLPEGILPPDLKGFDTDKAQASGSFKDGKLDLKVLPKILPVTIVIDAVRK